MRLPHRPVGVVALVVLLAGCATGEQAGRDERDRTLVLLSHSDWDDKIADKGREAALITDTTKRSAAYKEITEYVLHNGPYAVLYQPTELFGLRSNVKGFAWNPMGWLDFASITK